MSGDLNFIVSFHTTLPPDQVLLTKGGVIRGMVVWYGMADMVWHGMIWYSMVWHGMAWYGMALCGIACYG